MNIFPTGNVKCKINHYPQDNYIWVRFGDNLWMDKYEIRRQRLEQLVKDRAGGNKAKFAELIDRSGSYVSRMLFVEGKAGKKRIADDMIEHIEEKLDLGRGWFDKTITSGSASCGWPFDDVSLPKVKALSKQNRDKLEGALLLTAAQLGLDISNKSPDPGTEIAA